MSEPPKQTDNSSQKDTVLAIQKTPPQELKNLLEAAASGGQLNRNQHQVLASVFSVLAEREPGMVASVAIKQQMYSGPLPHFEQLNGYDDTTKAHIVEMALKEQQHTHEMQRKGLSGAIWKDRTAQVFALIIAVTGLLSVAWMSQHSAVAASIIGSVDLLGIICAFIAPRALEILASARKESNAAKGKGPVKPRQRRK